MPVAGSLHWERPGQSPVYKQVLLKAGPFLAFLFSVLIPLLEHSLLGRSQGTGYDVAGENPTFFAWVENNQTKT